MRQRSICLYLLATLFLFKFHPVLSAQPGSEASIPLPEHPRPDHWRPQWLNLNGAWQFRFDKENEGIAEGWDEAGVDYPREITVPFSWAAPLSGVTGEADIGWYRREIAAPVDWDGRRIFLVVGAADWHTTAWLDGHKVGEHRGGYTPFEFELTDQLQPGTVHRLVLRVDDTPHDFKLEGKQGYGPARGIWQTPYLEARGGQFLKTLHFVPDIEAELVKVKAVRAPASETAASLQLVIRGEESRAIVTRTFEAGQEELNFEVPLPDPHLWSLDDPSLYEVEATLGGEAAVDTLNTYFGMREISVVDLPGTDHRYVALNGEPLYLQLALDQAYHPEGYYTFPSDEFIRNEVLRSRRIGLNGMRVHVKVGLPRKLYWADRLGILIMADVPNSWGQPGPEMKRKAGYAMRQMIHRDFNHPSIFSWVLFNETWGLYTTVDTATNKRRYLPETQEWVISMYREAKQLDPTRLVEDNSVCCGIGHTQTDLNTWHSYRPGWEWEDFLSEMEEETYEASTWNFEEGHHQGRQPNVNSEFGNVWGYEGSTGDVDWSWDYHRALNAFRRHPGIAGWLYTEHHDVINEWNGYWRYDRSEKETGMGALVDGMSLRDLHSPIYVSTGQDISREAAPGEIVDVPVYASFLTGREDLGDTLRLRAELYGWDALGQREDYFMSYRRLPYKPWWNGDFAPLRIPMPGKSSVAVLALTVEDILGNALHRNFTTFIVKGDTPDTIDLAGGRRVRLLTFAPTAIAESAWSQKEWMVREGRKVNGAGAGFFEYRLDWPADLDSTAVESAALLIEASAKQLFGKDRDDAEGMGGDYMRGGGTFDPSRNPNAYPMTDEEVFPSAVQVKANGYLAGLYELPDDPADHRGILSWHYQLQDGRLREAGSYGYRLSIPLPPEAIREAARNGELMLRLEVSEALPGGLAIYGAEFGRYPMDPTVVLVLKE